MGSSDEYASNDELIDFRKELESMLSGEGLSEEQAPALVTAEEQILMDLADAAELSFLTIEENGSYVKTDDENMCAWLYLMPPGENKGSYTLEEIKDFLKKNGVMAGYHHSNLAAMIKKKVYEREVIVAEGQAPIEGNDGYYDYKFDPDQYKTPKLLANGRVDYTSMSTLQNVHAGDVVAIYHHAKDGQDGYDIQGRTLPARAVREIPPLVGQSVYTKDDPDIYYAQKDGKIELKNGRIDIQAKHEIDGDVTLITGKVEFFGDIVINGNVESGVVIRAGRNIEIKGTVEAVNLFAGGDIILSRGIQGAQRAKVSARGNIYADFIEHTSVTAGGNVQANSIINSRVAVDGNILLTGKKGAIVGGYTHALLGITATEIGNDVEKRTVVHVGCEKEVYLKMQNARTREKAFLDEVKMLSEQVTEVVQKKKVNAANPAEVIEKRIKEIEGRLKVLKPELKETNEEIRRLEALLAKGQGAQIIVNGNIFQGTVISIGQAQMPVEHSTCFMKYYMERSVIESSVLAYS